jgi:hypothetical protein
MSYIESYVYWIQESTDYANIEAINQKVRTYRGRDIAVEDEFHTRPWTRWTYF